MKRRTVVTLAVSLLLLGSGMGATGGPTQVDIPFEKTTENIRGNVTYSFNHSGSGSLILQGQGEKHGSKVIVNGTDDESVYLEHLQRDPNVTIYGGASVLTKTYSEKYSSVPAFESKNVTIQNGKLILRNYTVWSDENLEDFEDGSALDEYEYTSSSPYTTITSPVKNGSYALQFSASSFERAWGSDEDEGTADDLSNITRGEEVAAYTRLASASSSGIMFMTQGKDQLWYQVIVKTNTDEVVLRKDTRGNGGTLSILESTSAAVETGEWYKITWKTYEGNNTIHAWVSDPNEAQTWKLNGTDSQFGSGEIGFSGDNDGAKRYFDWVQGEDQVTKYNESGYAITKFDSTESLETAQLQWTEDESGGSIQHYVSFGSPSGWVGWTAEKDWKNISNGTDAYVKSVLNHSSSNGPSLNSTTLKANSTVYVEDPSIDIDSDGNLEASYSGILREGESITRSVDDLNDGNHTFDLSSNSTVPVRWQYTGYNESRVYVESVQVRGETTAVNQYLASGETYTQSISVSSGNTTFGVTTNTGTTPTSTVASLQVKGNYPAYKGIYLNTTNPIRHKIGYRKGIVWNYSHPVKSGEYASDTITVWTGGNMANFTLMKLNPDSNKTVAKYRVGMNHGTFNLVLSGLEPTTKYVIYEDSEVVTVVYTNSTGSFHWDKSGKWSSHTYVVEEIGGAEMSYITEDTMVPLTGCEGKNLPGIGCVPKPIWFWGRGAIGLIGTGIAGVRAYQEFSGE